MNEKLEGLEEQNYLTRDKKNLKHFVHGENNETIKLSQAGH